MKKINNKLLVAFSVMVFLSSCNKEPEALPAIVVPPYPSGTSLAATIAATVTDSLYNRIIIKSGMAAVLGDNTKTFTMFVPDNNALIATFGSLAGANGAIASFSATTCAGIVSYNTVATKFPASAITTGFANNPLPSLIVLDPTQPFVRMPIFPSKRAVYAYVNNIPMTAVDQVASNGIIHHTGALVAPPSATLKTIIAAEPTLSYFRAAVARADSGSVGLSKFDSLLNYGVTNMTVLVPNDVAFQNLLIPTITQALINQGVPPATAAAQAAALASTPAVFSNPALNAALPASTVQGIIAYHFLATLTTSTTTPYQPNIRVFSNNIPATPLFVKTLVNNGKPPAPLHPGVMLQATYTGPVVSSLKISSYGTFPPGGAAFSYTATALTLDKHAVNGVYHIIDKVLLPQ